jgi:hypothetical protein
VRQASQDHGPVEPCSTRVEAYIVIDGSKRLECRLSHSSRNESQTVLLGIGAFLLLLGGVISYTNHTIVPLMLGLLAFCLYAVILSIQSRRFAAIVFDREKDRVFRDGLPVCRLAEIESIAIRKHTSGEYDTFDVIAQAYGSRTIVVARDLTEVHKAEALAGKLAEFTKSSVLT